MTYKKAAKFHLLQKTICCYTCYVCHKCCPQEINLPQDVSNIVKKIILIRIQNFENATHRRNADYTCTASFNFWIWSIPNIPYQTKPYQTKLYQIILVLKPFLSPLPQKITSMSDVQCPCLAEEILTIPGLREHDSEAAPSCSN